MELLIVLSNDSECAACTSLIPAGSWVWRNAKREAITCLDCRPRTIEPQPTESLSGPILGTPGASARREYERRHDAAEVRNLKKFGKLGHLVNAIREDPQSTRAWAQGEKGELAVGRRLDKRAGHDFIVLHDRAIPRSRANVDHIVVARSGIYVVDSKRYKDKKVELRKVGPLFSREPRLFVGGRDKTKIVADLLRQIERVRRELDGRGHASARLAGYLCFVEADWGLLAQPIRLGSVGVIWSRGLVKAIDKAECDEPLLVHPIAEALAEAFPER